MLLSINMWDLFLKIQERAWQFLQSIWTGNYEIFESTLFGVSLIDLIGLGICLAVFVQFLKFLFNIIFELGREVVKRIFSYLFSLIALLLKKILSRAKVTLTYLWHTESFRRARFNLMLQMENFLFRIR